ncbi:MAG: pre-16S rRNA-processing nuclease YqgF [Firmicutes bacterium]|nr:pre-16S rRNA-processing nuclease YqgF [Bacillota bacterium]
MQMILAIDPGKCKFGYAVLTNEKKVLRQGTADVRDLSSIVTRMVARFDVKTVVIGDRTGGNQFYAALKPVLLAPGLSLALVEEDGSSREGRERFLKANRKGWRRLVPLGLQTPWRAYDDYVAVILGERYLDRQ